MINKYSLDLPTATNNALIQNKRRFLNPNLS